MLKLRIFSTFGTLLFSFVVLFSQEGSPLLTHYRESREARNQNWAICQDNNNTMLFANRRGLLSYDGQEWNSISLPIVPFALAVNPFDNKVYVGGENSYGYIEKDTKGIYEYFSLSADSLALGMITRIIFTDSTIYFYGDRSISRHRVKDLSFDRRWTSKSEKPFTGMFTTPKNIFINVSGTGLYRLESDTLFPIVTGYMTENNEILFGLPYDKKMVLVGLDNNKLSLFDGIKYYEYSVKDDGYISNSVLSEGIAISDSLYAFSTLEGGTILVEKKTGKLMFTLNYQNGLPDDEIFAMGLDSNSGLWLSHAYGLSRADLKLPIRKFSIYPGLQGNLITSIWYQDELYVGTSEGVYYLIQVKNYSETQMLVKINRDVKASASVTKKETASTTGETVIPRKSILAKLFGKKSTTPVVSPKEVPAENSGQSDKKPITATNAPEYAKKTVSTLKSIDYQFKKIEGVNGKCKQLVQTDNGILVATNIGLFQVSNHKGFEIVKNDYINYISEKTNDRKYFIGTNAGFLSVDFRNNRWVADPSGINFTEPVYSITFPDDKSIWIGSDDKAIRFDSENLSGGNKSYSIDTDFPQQYSVQYLKDTIFLLMESGMYFFDSVKDNFIPYKPEQVNLKSGFSYIITEPDAPWIRQNNDWLYFNGDKLRKGKEETLLKIFDDIQSVFADNKNMWVIDGNNSLYRISLNTQSKSDSNLNVYIKNITNEEGKFFELSDIVFSPGDDVVYFNIIAPYYLKERSTQYQYLVEGLMTDWSKWSGSSTIVIPAEPGKFTLHVRAKDIWDNISAEKEISYTIKPPLTKSGLFYLFIILVAAVVILLIVKARERKLQHDKKVLEDKVAERTAEIEAQKKEITSSIQYASRIQMAMLPEDEHFANAFDEHFIIFRPRDIVSGDFYWFEENNEHIYFTAADCTGHGVPGAFMSMLGISALQEITSNHIDLKANMILDMLRMNIKNALHQTGKEGEAADGMDMALCILHKDRKLLEFAGAYIPIYVVHNGQFIEYKADRMPIGIYHGKKESFKNNEIKVSKGDIVYFLSDGFIDQFGGPDGGKFKRANLKKLLSQISMKPLSEQKEILISQFEKWKGSNNQVDDVTVIGVKI
jgi:serine phosphatase RsbU (regulator of sigma subunit)